MKVRRPAPAAWQTGGAPKRANGGAPVNRQYDPEFGQMLVDIAAGKIPPPLKDGAPPPRDTIEVLEDPDPITIGARAEEIASGKVKVIYTDTGALRREKELADEIERRQREVDQEIRGERLRLIKDAIATSVGPMQKLVANLARKNADADARTIPLPKDDAVDAAAYAIRPFPAPSAPGPLSKLPRLWLDGLEMPGLMYMAELPYPTPPRRWRRFSFQGRMIAPFGFQPAETHELFSVWSGTGTRERFRAKVIEYETAKDPIDADAADTWRLVLDVEEMPL